MSWEVVIGLEVHVQLATQSKIFSGSSTEFGAEPNTQASLIDLGMPGVLPVLNADAVEKAVKFGLGIDAQITPKSVFARKNYFYPDLPKGYQISQFELPIVGMGHIEITLEDGSTKRIGVTRAHLEEDAGKSLHEDFHGMSGIDLNRAGTPLLEIVSEPDMRSAKEAVAYAKAIHSLIRYLGISDGDMSQGSMRCDCNVSLRQKGEEKFGTRREIKNVNSFKNVEKAINAEIEWQMDELESGREIQQATVLYDVNKDKTFAMRSKEEANDYRYFPDPDLLPLEVTEAVINRVRQDLPELPTQKIERFMAELELSDYDARVLAADRVLADYFETVVKESGAKPKLCANWVSVELLGALNKNDLDIDTSPVSAEQLGGLVKRIADNTISGKIAKQIFEELWNNGGTADQIIEAKGLKQETDTGAIEAIVDQVIADSADQVAQYLAADDNKRKKLIGYFVGQTMKLSKGKANPQMVNQILAKKLV
ncbi:Asp-tRNA(Asn)/Glu-tRNA(Gln) amidotransferase subunit GatB [Ketobacter sp.]|uniref:Asp-tRNA(Asn)/Glu-tRNA(Gln) amidotransferase subunit GatB n=1 Tax=Ketobacter sp. TaxID=2083498 RepID=UPI000F13B289|nr:Asp-tRNA(Asn)/Glu-tRNA(Gln) amidotransferase subunit GatB [Ketobacter sp.]RLT94169.1 MAG: Asp-tRNA(Asn)/Glu-tRNA(Gln) amidotransferase subunit GatB [Ketobacter sp.]